MEAPSATKLKQQQTTEKPLLFAQTLHLFLPPFPIIATEEVETGEERMIMQVWQVTHPIPIVSRLDDVPHGIVLAALKTRLNNNELIAQDGIVWAVLNQ